MLRTKNTRLLTVSTQTPPAPYSRASGGTDLALREVIDGAAVVRAIDVVGAVVLAKEARLHVQTRVGHRDYLVYTHKGR